MEKGRKGCLIMIITLVVMATGIYIGTEYDCLYLKNVSMMMSAFVGGYVGSVYLNPPKEKPVSQSHWKWYFLAVFLLAGVLTWLESYVF